MLSDSAQRYGLITRTLHWTMAALFAWQFTGMVLKYVLGRVPLMAFWVGTHPSVGTLLFLLILIRVGWALGQKRQRPSYGEGIVGNLAKAGHLAMYVLMIVVPTLGLLRMLGDVRPVSLFGVMLSPGGGAEVPWMTAPANLVHGILAWVLLALIVGHVAMVIVHRFVWRDDTLSRMIGRA
ncbi:MAG TPA: cytochrome b [Croceibacterium sp.]|nr:cytochrome b [Croceibacterium sp.]